MNHVNLIGKISSEPKVLELENGRKIAQFSLSTSEVYLDGEGNTKERKQWHRISAWGRWVSVLEKFGQKGLNLAVEGRLVSRFYKGKSGDRRFVVEVEVNDLILL
jgi:single-strand DNA-binding protein